ncbi:MAG: RIP metalloprotease RseP [Spartobacteria bacterium]|nr:RIP metalloprotease RseP [Spartobacteria bacterium]
MVSTIASIVYGVFIVIFLFGLTIFVHELGHYLTARWCGLVIDVFSIGFGPALWKKKINGIVYKIGWIPFGGYVALPQMEPGGQAERKEDDDDAEDDEDERPAVLPPVAPWKKIIVSVAGVVGNMILAFILAFIVYWFGQSYAPARTNIIGYIDTNSTAYAVGLRIGDEITAVNGSPVESWEAFLVECALVPAPELSVTDLQGAQRTVAAPTESVLGSQMVKGIAPYSYCYVLRVLPGSSAEAAGLLAGDRVESLNGQKLFSRDHLIEMVNESKDQEVPVVVEREGALVDLRVTPRFDEGTQRVLIGIEFNPLDVKPPLEQIKGHAMMVIRLLQAFTKRTQAKAAASAVGGPIAILTMFWYSVHSSFLLALSFTCLVNVNLAVLNLLPIPVLDGGHIVFALYEIITRRPINKKVVDTMINVFAVLLIGLFLLLSFRDVKRLILPMFGADTEEAAQETPGGTPPETPAAE